MTISKRLFYPSSWVLKSCITSYQKIVYAFSFMFIYKNIFMHMILSSNGIGFVREEVLFYSSLSLSLSLSLLSLSLSLSSKGMGGRPHEGGFLGWGLEEGVVRLSLNPIAPPMIMVAIVVRGVMRMKVVVGGVWG